MEKMADGKNSQWKKRYAEKWSPRKMAPGKMVPGKNVLEKLFFVKRILGKGIAK